MPATRTDRIRDAIAERLEAQRPCLDADAPLTTVTVFVDLHPDGNVRRVKFRADDARDRSSVVTLNDGRNGDARHAS